MEERELLILLFDYYGNLLNKTQQDIFKDYYYDNLTMEEISINNNTSKNAVSKQIISIKKKLYNYEDVLKLNYKSNKIRSILDDKYIEKIEKYI